MQIWTNTSRCVGRIMLSVSIKTSGDRIYPAFFLFAERVFFSAKNSTLNWRNHYNSFLVVEGPCRDTYKMVVHILGKAIKGKYRINVCKGLLGGRHAGRVVTPIFRCPLFLHLDETRDGNTHLTHILTLMPIWESHSLVYPSRSMVLVWTRQQRSARGWGSIPTCGCTN